MASVSTLHRRVARLLDRTIRENACANGEAHGVAPRVYIGNVASWCVAAPTDKPEYIATQGRAIALFQ